MLRLEVSVMAIDQKYEFSLDEDTKVGSLIEEIYAVVATKLDQKWEKRAEQLQLSDKLLRTLLPKDLTLRECGVKAGHELLLL